MKEEEEKERARKQMNVDFWNDILDYIGIREIVTGWNWTVGVKESHLAKVVELVPQLIHQLALAAGEVRITYLKDMMSFNLKYDEFQLKSKDTSLSIVDQWVSKVGSEAMGC